MEGNLVLFNEATRYFKTKEYAIRFYNMNKYSNQDFGTKDILVEFSRSSKGEMVF